MIVYGFTEHYWKNNFKLTEEEKKEKKKILREEFNEKSEFTDRDSCE